MTAFDGIVCTAVVVMELVVGEAGFEADGIVACPRSTTALRDAELVKIQLQEAIELRNLLSGKDDTTISSL
jgi:hypothetical protein